MPVDNKSLSYHCKKKKKKSLKILMLMLLISDTQSDQS